MKYIRFTYSGLFVAGNKAPPVMLINKSIAGINDSFAGSAKISETGCKIMIFTNKKAKALL